MRQRKLFAGGIQGFAQNIMDTMREPPLIFDAALRVRSADRAFCQMFEVSF